MRKIIKILIGIAIIPLLCTTGFVAAKNYLAPKNAKEIVVLLHGIGNSEWNMSGIEFALHRAGYQTLNIGYPSLEQDIDSLSDYLAQKLDEQAIWLPSSEKIVHFTTHSMGGLVLRTYLNKHKEDIPKDKLGRVVMLAPPHGGSEVADFLENFPLYQWIYGPAGQELTTKTQSHIETDVYYELGIIAGNKAWPYLIAAHVIPNESDGRVALEKTKLEGMKDHITLSATHTFISWKPETFKHIIYFLENGEFHHGR